MYVHLPSVCYDLGVRAGLWIPQELGLQTVMGRPIGPENWTQFLWKIKRAPVPHPLPQGFHLEVFSKYKVDLFNY